MGIWAKNRKEWMISMIACMYQSVTTVGLYKAMNEHNVNYILNQTELETIIAEAAEVDLLLKYRANGKCEGIKRLVLLEDISSDSKAKAETFGIELLDFEVLVQEGSKSTTEFNKTKYEDTYAFSYTSGTTGDSKGVKLHHGMITESLGIFASETFSQDVLDNLVHISYLPYPHIFEQGMTGLTFQTGGRIGYYHGNPLKIPDDM